ncbi:MAG: hypothetical protein QG673_2133 [Pseudomonadota bacterium]|nr:hypothetical protein [Pseudomonadota bacterium]
MNDNNSCKNDSCKIVTPEQFTPEHLVYLNDFKKSLETISAQSNIIFGAKDVNSKHITATNAYAKIVGLNNGNDVSARLDKEMPCEGTAQYADCYVREDLSLINSLDPEKNLSVLNVHHYSDGLKARLFKKHLLYHKQSNSILGTIYSGFDLKFKDILNIIPSYIMKFSSRSLPIGKQKLINDIELTDYEQEICFLLILNWEFKQIANFMNETRPMRNNRTADTIIKKKNYICEKLNLPSTNVGDLQDFLVSIGFHNSMPTSFYNRIVGSTIL